MMIPVFLLFRKLGWINTFLLLTIPALFDNAFFIFMLHRFFVTVLRVLLDETKYTLSLGLAMFQGQYEVQYGRLMAASAPMTCPIVILFFFAQRQFIEGVKMTGIKG